MKDIQNAIAQLDWKREPYGLYEPIEYILNLGGKRLRPMLAVLASQIFNGNKEDVIPAALALEVFHNFTLLHDDVMDKADMRRGHPTVHTKWNENTAILSGDQMMIEAYKQKHFAYTISWVAKVSYALIGSSQRESRSTCSR